MRVLFVHNFYRSAASSGEDVAYVAERDFLKEAGHEVLEFCRSNEDLAQRGAAGSLIAGLAAAWNPAVWLELRGLLRKSAPDVMHVHNTFPLLSPAVFHAARGLPTATVLTVHNYRIFCAAGTASSGRGACVECLAPPSVRPAIRRGCYRDSRIATLAVAGMIALHRNMATWRRQVDAFIALSSFQRDILISAGVPQPLICIKPNFYPNPPVPKPWEEREQKAVFLGRLGPEKGVKYLIDAWNQWGPDAPALEVIGDGPEMAALRIAANKGAAAERIRFLGRLPFREGQERLSTARLLILPSICFEGFPQTIREAFALGVPVAASRLGSLECIVGGSGTGALFPPLDAAGLRATAQRFWNSGTLRESALRARAAFEAGCSARAHYEAILEIYRRAIERRAGRVAAGMRGDRECYGEPSSGSGGWESPISPF